MNNKASKNGLGEYLKLVKGWITGAIGFVTIIVSFLILLQKETMLVFMVSLIVGIVLLLGNLLYVRLAPRRDRDKLLAPGPDDKFVFSKPVRRRALVGIYIVVTLLFVDAGLFIWGQLRPSSSDKVIILVADFDGPDQTYGVTETIVSRLRAATREYDDVQVQALNETFTTQQGSSVARARGEERGASIVLWGWYRVPRDSALVTVHFEVLRRPSGLVLAQGERSQKLAVAELESFQIQTRLSNEMRYLTLLTLGLARYELEEYDAAIGRFTGALDLPDVPEDMVDPADIYFYRGTAYGKKGEYDQAIADFDRALDLNPKLVEAYNNRGVVYKALADSVRAAAGMQKEMQRQH